MHLLHLEDSVNDAELVAGIVVNEWPTARIERVASRAGYQSLLARFRFDLILSDYSLPGFDGLAALDAARAHCPETPFLFFSGTIGEERAIEALQRGAADYVIKDRPTRLVPALRTALAQARETARRRSAESELLQNRERFRLITENVADRIAVLDRSARLIYCNPAFRRAHGEVVAAPDDDFFQRLHPADREAARRGFFDALRSGQPRRLEYRLLDRDGGERFIEAQFNLIPDATGMSGSVLAVSRDVTERRLAEQRLREQAALLDKAREAIFATDLEHRVTYWNAGAERLYGWPAAEVRGLDLREFASGRDPARFTAACAQVRAAGEWRGAFQLTTRGGTPVQVESRWSLVVDPAGRPASILVIESDVTEKKNLEAQLRRSQRVESLGMLAGGVAHDLNNVLAPIQMGVELLRLAQPGPAEQRVLRSIESRVRHGASLVRQLVAFARGTEVERMDLNLVPLLQEVRELLGPTLPRAIEVTAECAPGLDRVLADGTQLKQVLLNLCINARDAMPQGGAIALTAANVEVDADLAGAGPDRHAGPHVCLSVADTGTGIPPELMDRIFDPFFTTKEEGKGTGLGLAMVRDIVKSHEGFLTIESRAGSGTTFRIYLPALPPPPTEGPGTTEPFAAQVPLGRGEVVLLVEDDPAVRLSLRSMLERCNYRVVDAANSHQALDWLQLHRGEAAALVADAALPGIGVAEFFGALRALDPAVGVVTMSDTGRLAVPAGAEHLVRPVELAKLLHALRRVIPTPAR